MRAGHILRVLRKTDWLLLFATVVLVLFGLSAIYSVALSHSDTELLNVKKQLLAGVIGFTLFVFLTLVNYRLLRSYSLVLYLLGLMCLLAVLWFGNTIRGTTGWFDFGFLSFQPVEYMKLALPVALAAYLSERARRHFGWRELLESFGITLVPVIFTLLQPDLGSAMLLLAIWGLMILFAGIPRLQFFLLTGGGILLGVVAWFFLLADYQKDRILTFFEPERDPLGIGYNVTQAIIGVGSGGWFGRGLGFGSQSQLKFIPESQTDFIFAVIAEELGFIGVTVILLALGALLWAIMRRARTLTDDFGAFLMVGIGGSLFVQSVVNIGMNLGLLPVTGLGLPLVSYGGSSLLFTLMMLGIVNSVARSSPQAGSSMIEWKGR
ncbi:MAG: Rod shape-determining protein RodA [Candidatus Uhrbacteria bacterium GW2011_GWA2_53_10]|uniref:Rod shape-determining protein RodA n=1 Tax=Candidatus Uhrbacteria bacterium GW2011_GWA2_53_10 TaxID=1618980 RepID=A0A0G1ZX96_9BACT|nr:MAG: Rod shape-determining protein RodA [Candidatus Uhrbacteria bacterium GW2011_GWA2_53_10]